MPIYASNYAREFWKNALKPEARARTLASAKYVTLPNGLEERNSWRKSSCEAIATGSSFAKKLDHTNKFVINLLSHGATILHAKLEARLIIDTAGGVIENGGICLDRTSGIPFIPGSAVKGCARRHAIYQLSEESDLQRKAILLAQIAICFGYGDQEWKPGRYKDSACSDYWLAMVSLSEAGQEHDLLRNERWTVVSEQSARLIYHYIGKEIKDKDKPVAPQLPSLAGQVAFFPAYPNEDARIEIDVITPHHPDYYSAANKKIATDDEAPNPILFPTVAANTIFCFPIMALNKKSRMEESQLFKQATPQEFARNTLTESLKNFGLGAKTNSGYGWFSIDESADEKFALLLKEQKEAEEIKELKPCPTIQAELQMRLTKNQLAGDLNIYSFDPHLWPKDKTILYQLTLFQFIIEHAPNLATSKKGEKAMLQLSKKLNQPLP